MDSWHWNTIHHHDIWVNGMQNDINIRLYKICMKNFKKLAFWRLLDVFNVYHHTAKRHNYIRDKSQFLPKQSMYVNNFQLLSLDWGAKIIDDEDRWGNFQRNILCSYFGNFSNAINEPKKFCSFDNVCIWLSCKISNV